jgi:hypothetical protein
MGIRAFSEEMPHFGLPQGRQTCAPLEEAEGRGVLARSF